MPSAEDEHRRHLSRALAFTRLLRPMTSSALSFGRRYMTAGHKAQVRAETSLCCPAGRGRPRSQRQVQAEF